MSMQLEKPAKTKSKNKRKTKESIVETRAKEDDESSEEQFGMRYEAAMMETQRKKQCQRVREDLTKPKPGLRPKDDLTREIAIGPSEPPDSDDDSDEIVCDDDSKHYNEELLSQKSMTMNPSSDQLQEDSFGNYGVRTSFSSSVPVASAVQGPPISAVQGPPINVVARLPPLVQQRNYGLGYYGLDPPSQDMSVLTASQLSTIMPSPPTQHRHWYRYSSKRYSKQYSSMHGLPCRWPFEHPRRHPCRQTVWQTNRQECLKQRKHVLTKMKCESWNISP